MDYKKGNARPKYNVCIVFVEKVRGSSEKKKKNALKLKPLLLYTNRRENQQGQSPTL